LWERDKNTDLNALVVAVVACAGLAVADPKPAVKVSSTPAPPHTDSHPPVVGCAQVYAVLSEALIVALFLLLGLTLDIEALRQAAGALHVHLFVQLFSLVLTPLAYFGLVYHWRWEVSSGILQPNFAAGVMAALCMPTTT
jgi:hypothetical protein